MSKNVNHLQHLKSNVVNTVSGVTTPKLPQASDLIEGELAINYATGYETISLKNASGDVVTFSSDGKILNIIKDNEEITAYALTDLDSRISGLTWGLESHEEDTSVHVTSEEKKYIGTPISAITQVETGTYTLNASENTYYRFDTAVSALVMNSPNSINTSKISKIYAYVEFDSSSSDASFNFLSSVTGTNVLYCKTNDAISPGSKYFITITFDGINWIVKIENLSSSQ